MSKTFTYSDVAEHNTKKDCFIVVHDKVYDASKFIDEHPGGEEVMLDVAGQDSTEAFEDVGHSDEAREILDGLLVGELKRGENDPKPKTKTQVTPTANGGSGGGSGLGLYVLILLGGVVAYGAYQYLEGQKQKQ